MHLLGFYPVLCLDFVHGSRLFPVHGRSSVPYLDHDSHVGHGRGHSLFCDHHTFVCLLCQTVRHFVAENRHLRRACFVLNIRLEALRVVGRAVSPCNLRFYVDTVEKVIF